MSTRAFAAAARPVAVGGATGVTLGHDWTSNNASSDAGMNRVREAQT